MPLVAGSPAFPKGSPAARREVRERIPPSAAAVLINRDHEYTDLYLPIDAEQETWLGRIDGERTVGEIVGEAIDDPAALDFFRRLWAYDQVVFDTSANQHPPDRPSPAP